MNELRSIRGLIALLTAAERRRLVLFSFFLVLTGGLEILGLGMIFIFTGLLNELSSGVELDFRFGGFDPQLDHRSIEQLAAVGGLLLIGIFAIKAGLILGVQILLIHFIYGIYRRFSGKLIAKYLKAPLLFYLEHGTAEIQRNLNFQPSAIFNSAAVSLAYIASNTIAIVCLFAVLCFIDPLASMLAFLLLGMVGGIYYNVVRRRLLALGRQRHVRTASAIKWAGHAIAGIREMRLLKTEPFFRRGFQEQIRGIAEADRSIRIAMQLPSLINECALVAGLVGLMFLYLYSGRSLPELLPTLAAFGLAGVRMVGMAASTVSHMQQLQFHGPTIQAMRDLITELDCQTPLETTVAELGFERFVELKNVQFRFPRSSVLILRDISLFIPKGSRTALFGPSGSGKTTLLSILLGLLEPTAGVVLVDGKPIKSGRSSWYARLAYVPQSIFILDDTVRANILFGREDLGSVSDEEILMVLEIAQVLDVVQALPSGLDTLLGDNGAKLSGGERQRIGIARALLRKPDLLALDEATSALDQATERALLTAIHEKCPGMTLVVATHRVDAVKDYERRYWLQDGKLTALDGSQSADILKQATG